MIYGKITDAAQIQYLGNNIDLLKTAFDFLKGEKKNNLQKGKFFIEGTELFGYYSEYKTHVADNQVWESHRKYLDIQFLVSGLEVIKCSSIQKLSITEEYSFDTDAVLGICDVVDNEFKMEEGSFLILFPEEAHLPGITYETESSNKKIVIKIPVD